MEKERPKEKKKGKKEEGETFYRAHPISVQPGVGYRETSIASLAVERVLWWALGSVEIILLFRMVFAAFGAVGGNMLTSFVYAISYPFVWPFFYLFNTLDRISVTSPTFELETLAAMAFYYIVIYIITELIKGFRSSEV